MAILPDLCGGDTDALVPVLVVCMHTGQGVFATPLEGYHALLWLQWKANARAPQAVDATAWLPEGEYEGVRYKNLRPLRPKRLPAVDFDPVQHYLHALRVWEPHAVEFWKAMSI